MAKHQKALDARSATTLESIPNIGPSLAGNLRLLGINKPLQLTGKDPWKLYRALCRKTHARQDPCVLDTFIAAVRFMDGEQARPWWHYTAERKKTFDIPR